MRLQPDPMTGTGPSPRIEGDGRLAMKNRRKQRRQLEAGPGGKKAQALTTLPLLMQVIGILHLSALCARAVAVAGVVLSPAASTAPGRAAVVVVSRGGSLAVPAERVAARTTSAKERPQASTAPAVVTTERPSGEAATAAAAATAATAPPPAASPLVSSLCDKRRTAARVHTTTSDRSSSSCTFSNSSRSRSPWANGTAAFVVPPGSSTCRRGFRQHQCRALDGQPICSSRIPLPRASLDAVGLPRRRRPLSMGAGAAAAAAAAAALSVAARLAVPSGGIGGGGGSGGGGGGSPRPWSSLKGLDAASVVCAVKDSANGLGGGGGISGGSGGGGVSGRLSIQQALYAFMRWVLTGAGLGFGRRPRSDDNGGGGGSGGGVQGLFSSMWPFGGGGGGGTSRPPPPESGGASEGESAKRTAIGGSPIPTVVASAKTQQVQRQYPRPQSTAYPRPKVSVPTLLDLGAEEPADDLTPKKQWLAVSSGSPVVEEEAANPLLSKFLRWFFERMITSRAKLVEGLEVSVDARSNRDAMSGLLQVVGITFNHLRLETLQISGGATMRITGLDLKVMTLLWRRFRSFKKPFEVAGSYVFTSGDLATSPMVRRVVENMMNATLRKLETVATDPLSLSKSVITIMQVTAKRSRLVIDGEMVYDNVRVPFNYRTSIGVKGKGHVVYLKDPEVFWENVGGSLTLPLLPLQTFDIDIGDAARIESIRIVDGQVAVRARFVLSPFPPLVVASMLKRASFRYDVGERLSVTFGNLVQNMRII